MSHRRVRTLSVLTAAAISSGVAACDLSGHVYRTDTSIAVDSPKPREVVQLPLTLRWTDSRKPARLAVDVNDPNAEYYAIFVDRAPMHAGKTLRSLATGDSACGQSPDCPNSEQLRDLKVYLSTQPELVLDFLPDLRPSSRGSSKDPHEITIVRMRGDRRLGEAAFRQNFFVRR